MIGKKLTIFTVDRLTAETVKKEVRIIAYDFDRKRFIAGEVLGDKIRYLSEFSEIDLVFEGWGISIYSDAQSSLSHRNNGCLNLVGEEDLIFEYVENRNINDNYQENAKALIVLVDIQNHLDLDDRETLLYPSIDTKNGAILEIKKRA